jgi:hypothetical protein
MRKKSFFLGMAAMALVFGMAFAGCDKGTGDDADTYPIGSRGPGGGLIFYDKGVYSDGWRYLEAAPVDQSNNATWGLSIDNIEGTATGIGTGKENTHLIVAKYPSGNYAANLCKNYRGGDKDDWFLPSKDELYLMWENLKQQGLGNFSSSNSFYWSSSQYSADYSWYRYFTTVNHDACKNYTYSVRAVRAF